MAFSFACVFLTATLALAPLAEASVRESRLVTPLVTPDLDGDGIADILFMERVSDAEWGIASALSIDARSGATDQQLWTRTYDRGIAWFVSFLARGDVSDVLIEYHVLTSEGAWQAGYRIEERVSLEVVHGASGDSEWLREFSGTGAAWSTMWHDMPLSRENRIIADGFPVRAHVAGDSSRGREDVVVTIVDIEVAGTGVTRVARLDGESGSLVWETILAPLPGGAPPSILRVTDVDRDGVPDWLTASFLTEPLGTIVRMEGVSGASGRALFSTVLSMNGWPTALSASTLAGETSRVIITAPGSSTFAVVEAGSGALLWRDDRGAPTSVFVAPDVNGDGANDLLLLIENAGAARIEFVDSNTGKLVRRVDHASPLPSSEYASVSAALVSDVDGDGWDDVVIIQYAVRYFNDPASAVSARVISGRTGESFWVKSDPAFAGASPLGDVSGDARGDLLLVTSRGVDDVIESTWTFVDGATGATHWETKRTYTRGGFMSRWARVAVGPDVDGDGVPEVLVTVNEVNMAWGPSSWYVVRSISVIEAWSGASGAVARDWTFEW